MFNYWERHLFFGPPQAKLLSSSSSLRIYAYDPFFINKVLVPVHFFHKNTRLIFAQNLRTIQPQQKSKVSNFHEQNSKYRTISKVNFASRLFMYNC